MALARFRQGDERRGRVRDAVRLNVRACSAAVAVSNSQSTNGRSCPTGRGRRPSAPPLGTSGQNRKSAQALVRPRLFRAPLEIETGEQLERAKNVGQTIRLQSRNATECAVRTCSLIRLVQGRAFIHRPQLDRPRFGPENGHIPVPSPVRHHRSQLSQRCRYVRYRIAPTLWLRTGNFSQCALCGTRDPRRQRIEAQYGSGFCAVADDAINID